MCYYITPFYKNIQHSTPTFLHVATVGPSTTYPKASWSYSTEDLLRPSISLQLTSVLPVTCYVAVLWPEFSPQWQSDHCLWGCSGIQSRDEHLKLARSMFLLLWQMIIPHHLNCCNNYKKKIWMWCLVNLIPGTIIITLHTQEINLVHQSVCLSVCLSVNQFVSTVLG